MFKNLYNSKIKLSTHLALLSSVLIGVIVLFVSASVIFFLREISFKVDSQIGFVNRALSASFFQVLGPELEQKNYQNIDKVIDPAVVNNLIAYFVVKDNSTNKIVYSSVDGFENKEFTTSMFQLLAEGGFNSGTAFDYSGTYYVIGEKKDVTMYIGFFSKSILSQNIEAFINNMSVIIVFAIILGLLFSSFLTNIITKPLLKLAIGSRSFASGDFSHRIEKFNYLEIDELVDAYNSMASTLQDLYVSLENKVTERTQQLNNAYKELQNTQAMMVHSEKMKSLGELVAGITHEINNPVNFIYGNLIHLTNYTNDLIMLIDKYGEYEVELLEEHKKEIQKIKNDIDLAFLKEDISLLIQSCREGTERTKNIILDLKNFSRMEERVLSSIDVTKEIDTTLNILHSKYKNRIEIHKEYEEGLPLVESYGGQLNQVFMNILDNAFYAIEEKGDVYIRAKSLDNNVIIEIEDNGRGMDNETANKIFDPFFTTKPVGKGTGLGMSISYRVIKEHNGDIKLKTVQGEGSTFIITLPVRFDRKVETV